MTDMGYDETVGIRHGLGIYLSSSHDEAAGWRNITLDGGSGDCIGFFQRADDRHTFRSIKASRNDDIRTFRKRTSDGLECLASHDDGRSRSRTFEELQILGNMPQEGIVPAYGIIVRNRYYDAFFHIL